jgi:chloramphenicol-sensitive protein RarD
MNRHGVLSAVGAYTLWGILPVYWRSIQTVPAFEVLCHRTVWSFAFVALLLTWRGQWAWLRQAGKRPATLMLFLGSACVLALNWFIYIWAVNAGHILDASLGYFINPLISVLLGLLFLGERLRLWQWAAIGIAGCGVVFLTWGYRAFPWIALSLAVTFGFYGLLRKIAPLGALEGLWLEMAVLFLPALAALLYLERLGAASFWRAGTRTSILLGLTGVVTAVPLVWFAYGARRVTLATVGILQYIAPTLQFALGVWVYGESFTRTRMVGFGAIWIALLMYSLEGVLHRRTPGRPSSQDRAGQAEPCA